MLEPLRTRPPLTSRETGINGFPSPPPISRHDDWCPARESNPHTLRYLLLGQARLPVSPAGLSWYTVGDLNPLVPA